ncbi:MAG: HU family DNA-binding protein [Prevotella sp.]|nr:HU family DNA-binding protein [Prevotella sp.]
MIKNDIQDIAKVIAAKYGLKVSDSKTFINTFMDLVNEGLQEDGLVKIKGFGTFKIIEVKDRESINVTTGERFLIPGRNKVTFTPDSVMKEMVNKPFSQFDTVILNDGVDFSDLEQQMEDIVDDEVVEDIESVPVEHTPSDEVTSTMFVPMQTEEVTTDENQTEDVVKEEEPIAEQAISVKPFKDDEIEELQDHVISEVETPEVEEAVLEVVGQVDETVSKVVGQEDETVSDVKTGADELIQEESLQEEPVLEETFDKQPISEDSQTTEVHHLLDDNKHTSNHHKDQRNMKHRHDRKRTVAWWIPLGFLLSLIAGIAIGYHIGIRQIPAPLDIVGEEYADSVHDSNLAGKTETVKDNKENVSAVKEEKSKPAEEKKEVVAETKETTAAPQVVKQQPAKPATETVVKPTASANDSPILRNAKQMVSKGAYNIVGTTETITVKPGQNIKKISKFYFGDGMECYIQAYNNIDEVTEGMKLKIPQLKLKKK